MRCRLSCQISHTSQLLMYLLIQNSRQAELSFLLKQILSATKAQADQKASYSPM